MMAIWMYIHIGQFWSLLSGDTTHILTRDTHKRKDIIMSLGILI